LPGSVLLPASRLACMKRNASQTGGFLYREKVKLVLQEDAIYPEEMEKAGIYLNHENV
jgi:hypothetical protein